MDSDAAYREFMAALNGIAAGKGLTEIVRASPYGTQTRIEEALRKACTIQGDFPADHFDYVDAAFYKFGVKRPSVSIRICAETLLCLARGREPRDPFDSPSQYHQTLYGLYKRGIDGKQFKYEARYTREYPRTYDAKIWFGNDDSGAAERDHFKGPLLNTPMSEDFQRKLVQLAIESKIQRFEV